MLVQEEVRTDLTNYTKESRLYIISVIAGQTTVCAIFHLLLRNLKFQWALFSKFNIATSFVNGPFSVEWVYGPLPHSSYNTVSLLISFLY